ncbi:uncharacterized protein MONOS_11726 [Monocercomonoides exilis]|uniref:uncharacterized protein n=1 Tax=Monocercomonoides exilis TaxID=2049356 RepID=UPI00355A7ED1|nr:hypothetical protein MONOS_11726 [Monocercomonoides exilis]|eukprot:MONOS_11726.1-p1 / transcript=MONOS_11726.1 / gene=MONOS_11726 / organism=Monocercomonoides_exilis_PA203 / gene_product=unspecified product / transcript_product=unspecified product / location=Mono_scaffold00605:28626-31130(+) / protein_length=835 / sequence_SO=supercontig / SO=protein_coding / is_pseudo=false
MQVLKQNVGMLQNPEYCVPRDVAEKLVKILNSEFKEEDEVLSQKVKWIQNQLHKSSTERASFPTDCKCTETTAQNALDKHSISFTESDSSVSSSVNASSSPPFCRSLFCPVDFFATAERFSAKEDAELSPSCLSAMKAALLPLFFTPQNNLRLFINGVPISPSHWGSYSISFPQIEDRAQPSSFSQSTKDETRNLDEEFCHKQSPLPQSMSVSSPSPTEMKPKVNADSLNTLDFFTSKRTSEPSFTSSTLSSSSSSSSSTSSSSSQPQFAAPSSQGETWDLPLLLHSASAALLHSNIIRSLSMLQGINNIGLFSAAHALSNVMVATEVMLRTAIDDCFTAVVKDPQTTLHADGGLSFRFEMLRATLEKHVSPFLKELAVSQMMVDKVLVQLANLVNDGLPQNSSLENESKKATEDEKSKIDAVIQKGCAMLMDVIFDLIHAASIILPSLYSKESKCDCVETEFPDRPKDSFSEKAFDSSSSSTTAPYSAFVDPFLSSECSFPSLHNDPTIMSCRSFQANCSEQPEASSQHSKCMCLQLAEAYDAVVNSGTVSSSFNGIAGKDMSTVQWEEEIINGLKSSALPSNSSDISSKADDVFSSSSTAAHTSSTSPSLSDSLRATHPFSDSCPEKTTLHEHIRTPTQFAKLSSQEMSDLIIPQHLLQYHQYPLCCPDKSPSQSTLKPPSCLATSDLLLQVTSLRRFFLADSANDCSIMITLSFTSQAQDEGDKNSPHANTYATDINVLPSSSVGGVSQATDMDSTSSLPFLSSPHFQSNFLLHYKNYHIACHVHVIDIAQKRHTRMPRWLRLERRLVALAKSVGGFVHFSSTTHSSYVTS